MVDLDNLDPFVIKEDKISHL